MNVKLDHAIVPARNRKAAAELLAFLLGVPWAESGVGPFCPVYVNDGLTLLASGAALDANVRLPMISVRAVKYLLAAIVACVRAPLNA